MKHKLSSATLSNLRRLRFRVPIAVLLLAGLLASTTSLALGQSPHQHTFASGYLPQRVFSSSEQKFVDFETMLSQVSHDDVLFIGEQHDDPATHRAELAILEGIGRRRSSVALAMEMFERDVQPILFDFVSGHASLDYFIQNSRPWPNFATDYYPLVEFARSHNWSVIASNVPRPYAAQVGREGLSALDKLSPAERLNVAKQIECPKDDYQQRFYAAMSGHPHGEMGTSDKAAADAMMERFYQAQCVKDETMAESITNLLTPAASNLLVIHVNGDFHSDFHEGTAARVVRRLPKAKVRTISIVPVDDLDKVDGREESKRADYVIFVLKPTEKN